MNQNFNPQIIDDRVQKEIDYFLSDQPELKADVEYSYKIAIPDRPKAYLMIEFAKVLGVDTEKIMPFIITADMMMAAAMNDDDIIDDNDERCEKPSLWKIKGINSTIMVTGYMYGLIFSILKKYRPETNSVDFDAYQKSENLLLDYFRVMHIGQYRTTVSANSLIDFTLDNLEKLAEQKASLLFQYCSAVPAYFVNKYVKELEGFGYQLGIVRQYVSDAQDFLEVPPEYDYNKKDVSKKGARMEDFFTHQPNLILIITGKSKELSEEERKWFYNNWTKNVSEENKADITKKVVAMIAKTRAIEESKIVLKKIKEKIQLYLSVLPDEDFKENLLKWTFRSFPMD
ncbi:MAG: hypothetical protein ACD_11C00002G0002 [uncultured bacterium]|nr:MAG: hypothetical protein ACD_11C00002G0002 [uncultured bacterium]HBR71932.1 hypothetical protein [Candidatus Moranbacteria bacterium]